MHNMSSHYPSWKLLNIHFILLLLKTRCWTRHSADIVLMCSMAHLKCAAQISENMTRTARLNWGLLSKFMMRVNQRYPATDMVLTPTHLYCDSRYLHMVQTIT